MIPGAQAFEEFHGLEGVLGEAWRGKEREKSGWRSVLLERKGRQRRGSKSKREEGKRTKDGDGSPNPPF